MFNKVLIASTIFGVLCLLLTPVSTVSAEQRVYKPATKKYKNLPARKYQRIKPKKSFTRYRLRKNGPDLKPLSCTVSPSSPGTSDTIRLTIPVKNYGNAQAAFSASASGRIYVATGVGFGYNASTVPQFVGAGKTKNYSVTIAPYRLTAGDYNFIATIDPNNQITEINENNNKVTCQIKIKDTGASDLVIKSVWKTVGNPNNVDGYKWRFVIKNQGTQPARIVYPNRIISGGCSYYVYAPSAGVTFNPGQERTYEARASSTAIKVGTHACAFTVDPNRVVPESNETNNSVQTSVTVIRKN